MVGAIRPDRKVDGEECRDNGSDLARAAKIGKNQAPYPPLQCGWSAAAARLLGDHYMLFDREKYRSIHIDELPLVREYMLEKLLPGLAAHRGLPFRLFYP